MYIRSTHPTQFDYTNESVERSCREMPVRSLFPDPTCQSSDHTRYSLPDKHIFLFHISIQTELILLLLYTSPRHTHKHSTFSLFSFCFVRTALPTFLYPSVTRARILFLITNSFRTRKTDTHFPIRFDGNTWSSNFHSRSLPVAAQRYHYVCIFEYASYKQFAGILVWSVHSAY